MFKNFIVVIVFGFGLIGCNNKDQKTAEQPSTTPATVNLDQVLGNFIANNSNIRSLAMLAVKNDEIIYTHTAGFFDVANTRKPTQTTLYRTSSIAKLVISVALMQQVELGLLELDRDVSDYLGFQLRNPDYPDKVITPRMLAQHAAGLSNPAFGETTDELFSLFEPSTIVQLHPLIEQILTPESLLYQDTVWLNGQPGSVYKNSNLGMVILAYLVEKISGQHFTEYCRNNIFLPLGMIATSHYFPDLDMTQIAALYDNSNNLTQPAVSWFYPIGGLYTSTGDWANFMRMILNGGSFNQVQILQASSVEQLLAMNTPTNNQLAYTSNIGLIWREAAVNPGWLGHTGAGSQVTHVTEINQARKMGYVLFTNEGRMDQLIGPGSQLNRSIHQWLNQQ